MEYGQLSDNLGQAQTTRINELISMETYLRELFE